ncbi:MAG: TetR family transcriptional regulator, partial [Microbacterium sp.]|nr:TetR family transcriptional regulator [Microbacterium sp.]
MPRLIDHDHRNDEIAAAAFRVLARDGVAALSVRRVADEAGIATASLRR